MPRNQWIGTGGPKRPRPGHTFPRLDRGRCARADVLAPDGIHVLEWRVRYFRYAQRVLFQFNDGDIYDFYPVYPLNWYPMNPRYSMPGYWYNFYAAPAILDGLLQYRFWYREGYKPEDLWWWVPSLGLPEDGDWWKFILRYFEDHYGPSE